MIHKRVRIVMLLKLMPLIASLLRSHVTREIISMVASALPVSTRVLLATVCCHLRREAVTLACVSLAPLRGGAPAPICFLQDLFVQLSQDAEKEHTRTKTSVKRPLSQEAVAPGFVARGGLWRGTLSWIFCCAAMKVHVIRRFARLCFQTHP